MHRDHRPLGRGLAGALGDHYVLEAGGGGDGIGPLLLDGLLLGLDGCLLSGLLVFLEVGQQIVEGLLVGLIGLGGGADAEDLHRLDDIAAGNLIDHILTGDDMAEDGMLAVQPGGRHMGDEELAAVGVRAGVGHGEDAGAGVGQARVDLVGEGIAGAAGAGAQGAAALNHEIGDDAVELEAVVELVALHLGAAAEFLGAFSEADEVGHSERGLGVFEHADNFTLAGVELRIQAVFQFAFGHCGFSRKWG